MRLKGPKGLEGARGEPGLKGGKGPKGYTGASGRTLNDDGAIMGMSDTGNSAVISSGSVPGNYHAFSERSISGSSVSDVFPGDSYSGTYRINTTGVYLVSMRCKYNSPCVGQILMTKNGTIDYKCFDENYTFTGPVDCRFTQICRLTAGTELRFYYNIATGSSSIEWKSLNASVVRLY